MPLNLNGEEMRKMTERIVAENRLSVEVNTAEGLTVEAGKTWREKYSLGAFFRLNREKDKAAGVNGEIKW